MAGEIAAPIQRHVEAAIAEEKIPGCVVLVGRRGHIVHRQAYGHRCLEPTIEPMTLDTVFDLASLTKPIATSTSIMQLVERGDLRLRDRVSKYLPEYAANGKEDTTVEQLLVHSAGLIPDTSVRDYRNGWDEAYAKMCELEPLAKPGAAFKYSDVGFLLLGEIVKQQSKLSLDKYVRRHILLPLGMRDTMFNPPEELSKRAATTEKVDGQWRRGQVHDPRAFLLGGVAGHAGLFSTADDLAIYAQTILQGGERNGVRILSPRTIENWTRARDIQGNHRGLGWDMGSVYSRNRGEMMSGSAFGHGGFTGTAMWMDPELDLFVIFLSNRLHPKGKGEANDLAGRIATIASAACLKTTDHHSSKACADAPQDRRLPTQATRLGLTRLGLTRLGLTRLGPTRLGIDVLKAQQFALLRNKRIGLIANHTSQDAAGNSTVKLFADSPDVNLVSLFSPEHGIYGTEDHPDIGNTTEKETQLPVFSLYGKTRKPMPEQLANVDALVFDIQDIGCRFYTYVSTMGLAMEACAEAGKEFVVLDRPNPINGIDVEGPMLDAGSESFVGYHHMPVRHGMTAGELAEMFRAERNLKVKLTIVPVENWQRSDYLYDTGLPWVNTSPNMRSLTQAVLYPGVGLFETTNVSVGRGTDTPFEVFGAPWIDAVPFAAAIRSHNCAGLQVTPITFTPDASKHSEAKCQGVRFIVTDWKRFRPLDLAWAIGASLVELHGDDWESKRFPRLLGNATVLEKLTQGEQPSAIQQSYDKELSDFLRRRKPFLMY